ncbi:MAG: universal stress protein [Leptolyngbya sp. SIO4C1]|nr:universal stress protein [Leptolyngbya sp. SIO4C1]
MADWILAQALEIAQASQANLRLLHVLSGDDPDSPHMPIHTAFDHYPLVLEQTVWDTYNTQWQSYAQNSRVLLQQLCGVAAERGVAAEWIQVSGLPEQAICEQASTWDADVVVLGSRGHTGLRELFLGSVSNYVTHHAPCSVWVVRSAAHQNAHDSASATQTTA